MKCNILIFFCVVVNINISSASEVRLVRNFSTSSYFKNWEFSLYPEPDSSLNSLMERNHLETTVHANLLKSWIPINDFHDNILSCRLISNILLRKEGVVFNTSKNDCQNNASYSTAYMNYYKSTKYGYYEAKIKAASKGINNAFWFKSKNGYEIDIAEIHSPNTINITIHKWINGKNLSYGFIFKSNANLNEGFHKYGFMWKPEYMIFYFDDMPILKISGYSKDIESGTLKLSTAVSKYSGYDSNFTINKHMIVSYVTVNQLF